MKRLTKILLSIAALTALLLWGGTVVSAGWVQNSTHTWTYYDSSNRKATGWLQLGATWYHFDSSGIMDTGWKKIDGSWYFLNSSGAMKTGWLLNNGKWYYLNSNGVMKTGWLLNGEWYYLNSDGSMKTGWLTYNGNWFYLNGSGAMKTGWLQNNGSFYYLNLDGSMKTGWLRLGDKQYYLASDGKMVTGNQMIDGVSYSFQSDGALTSSANVIVDSTKYEQQVLQKVNEIRRNAGLPTLSYSSVLSRGARIRAEEISLKFDHTRPNGTNWYTVFSEIKQSADGTGENIARNYSTPEAVVQSWMDSSDHRKNILEPDFRYLGVCHLKKNAGDVYWVQLFSNSLIY